MFTKPLLKCSVTFTRLLIGSSSIEVVARLVGMAVLISCQSSLMLSFLSAIAVLKYSFFSESFDSSWFVNMRFVIKFVEFIYLH